MKTDQAPESKATKKPSYREQLARIRDPFSADEVLREIRDRPPYTRASTERVRDALEEWAQSLGDEPHPWRSPILHAQAIAEHALGHKEQAMDRFVAALLAMDREGPQPPPGVPRLYFFVSWSSQVPVEQPVPDAARALDPGRSRSLGTCLNGMGTLPEANIQFGAHLVRTARSGRSEDALAATIWLHAIGLIPGSWEEEFTAPAAVELLVRRRPGADVPPRDSENWRQGFELALEEAILAEDPVAFELRDERSRWAAWRGREATKLILHGQPDGSVWVWSLRREIRTRFAGLETPRGKELLALAERLVAWD